jgi:cell division protease FtsH
MRATDIALSMVREYGMSEKLGQVNLLRKAQSVFLGQPPESRGDYSDETARLIDDEVRGLIASQYEAALDILGSHRSVLDKGAKMLLEREKINGSEIRALMAPASEPDAVTEGV